MHLGDSVTIPVAWIFAFICIVLAAWFRRQSLSGKRNWDDSWEPVQPSLRASSSPITSVRVGITGCITWLIGWVAVIGLLLAAGDLVFTGGEGLTWLWRLLLR